MISLKRHKQRNETNTFELMAFSVRVQNPPKALKRHKQRNETNTFELMAFSVRVQNVPKAFKTLQKPSKHLERDPTLDVALVCDSHDDRFLQTAQISLKRCRFPYISLKRLKLLMISLKA